MFRHRKALALSCLGALLATACSSPPTSGADQAATGPNGEVELPDCPLDALAGAPKPVEVTLWHGLGGSPKETLETMADRFNASQDDVHVTVASEGSSHQEVLRKYESTAAADPSQLPDLVLLEDTHLRLMVDGGRVLPAQACMEADDYDLTNLLPAVRSTFSVNDVLYPAFTAVSTPILYYNKSHWARAGLDPEDPPGTLEELYQAARALKDAGVSERPLSLKLDEWFFTTWLSGVGVEMVNNGNGRDAPPTEATFDTPEAHELLEFLQRMNDEGLLNVFARTEGNIDHYLALAQQQSSMLIETSTASSTIADFLGGTLSADEVGEFDPSAVDLSNLVPGAAPFPGIEAPGQVFPSGAAFFILNTSPPEEQAAAWEFMKFMLQPENGQDWHLNAGYLPAVKAVQDQPDVQAFWENDVGGLLVHSAVEQLDDADPDHPRPLMGAYPDFADQIQQAMETVLLDGGDIDQALATAQANVTEALQRYEGSG